MKSIEYLEEIRKAEGLPRAVLKRIAIEDGRAVFYLVTDRNYSQRDVDYASAVSERYAPGMPACAKVIKSVPSAEGVCHAAVGFLKDKYPSLAAFVQPEDVTAETQEGGGTVFVGMSGEEGPSAREESVLDELSRYLAQNFCGRWTCEFRTAKRERGEIERETAAEEYLLPSRYFPVGEFTAIDGGPAPEHALYLADLNGEEQDLTVCGRVDFIEERQTRTGKPFFRLTITDVSGESRQATYFSKKATLEKVRAVTAGTSVCLSGNSEFYNGRLSVNVQRFNLGAPPAGYVAERRKSRPVPLRYKAVCPVPAVDPEQGNLFGAAPLPKEFLERTFVVFDLETTGTNMTPSAMDHITEIGAVKIENGVITERFSSFVACPVKLPQEIIDLTHITDDMLVGAPPVGDVLADFYKFTDGCILVGQNAKQFDCRFIRYYGEKEGFLFDQPVMDTMLMAQRYLPMLPKFNLQVLADHFGLHFNHHRAYDDAFVTAKIFTELVRGAGKLEL